MILSKPNLLFLVHRFPYPPNRGDRIRSFHMLRFLSEHYRVYLGTLYDETPEPDECRVLEELCEQVAMFPLGCTSRWARAIRSLASGRSATEGLFESPALRKRVDEWFTTIEFDVAIAFCSSMTQYMDGAPPIPLIVDLVDVDSQKWLDYANRDFGWKRGLYRLESRRLRALECRLAKRCNAITLVSQAEVEVFQRFCPNDRTTSVGNGVDLEIFRPERDRLRNVQPFQCVFVGALDYRANVHALEWFCQNCWPSIQDQFRRARLLMVGRNPVESVRRLAKIPGVELIGQVPDVRRFVLDSEIVIAPLQIARGVQNKVLEAMAMGMPIVASPQAIEGIGCRVDKHLLQADTPQSWINTLTNLFGDKPKQSALGLAARSFVERHHSWSSQMAPLLPLLVPSP
jgi:polysaccharide biosynthesis protein PslH